jgi:hypothetical protein
MKLDYKYLCEDTDYSDNVSVFYYKYNSDCDNFEFSILLDDDLCLWNETQSVTYKNKHKEEYWDNTAFLRCLLDFENKFTFKRKVILEKVDKLAWEINDLKLIYDDYGRSYEDIIDNTRLEIGEHKYKSLIKLLQQVRNKGWI